MLLGIYAREIKIYIHTKVKTHLFIAALFIMAPNWKQPKCALKGERTSQLCLIPPMRYDSAIKSNELLIWEAAWMV